MILISQHTFKKTTFLHALFLVLFLIFIACPARTVEPAYNRHNVESPGEYELKAIYLYNFFQFVQWPDEKCPLTDDREMEIGVLGNSSLKPVLEALREKLHSKGQQLHLTFYGPYHEGMDIADCCLLFISDSESDNLSGILDILANKPVLTVSDTDAFTNKGVMITLLSYKNKVRWAINREPLKKAGLRLSAKLLDIAVEVIN